MADPTTPLLRHQAATLRAIAATGQMTDASLSAFCAEVGETVDRTTLANYRMGRRQAPLGLLSLMLAHADDPSAILNVYARAHGLRVVEEQPVEVTSRDLAMQALDVSAAVGALVHEVHGAIADGRVDDDERAALLERVAAALRELHEVDGVLRAPLRAVR